MCNLITIYDMKKILLSLIVALSFASCSEDSLTVESTGKSDSGNATEIELKNGYLCFSSDSIFKQYLLNVENGQNSTRVFDGASVAKVGNFKSISQLQKELSSVISRSSELDDDVEEMTQDEYNLMKAENLLLDPVLEEVMDTTLRIQVDDRLYKVTEYGTFSVLADSAEYLTPIVENFDTTLVKKCQNGELLELGHSVVFANSFGKGSLEDHEMDSVETCTTRAGFDTGANLQSGYNTVDYAWKNHSVWQKFWDKIRGKDVSRENNFDKTHRVQMEVFNVNYLFYASAGVKVKMQKRKKFLFVKYWVGERADKIAVGFNCLTGKLKFKNPTSYSAIAPSNSVYWGKFQGALNGVITDFIISNTVGLPVIKNWVQNNQALLVLPRLEILNGVRVLPKTSVLKATYDASLKEVEKLLSSANNMYFSQIHKKIYPKDPRVAYMVWGESEYTFDQSKPYIMGVQEYSSVKDKTVRFDQSFGFRFGNGSGIQPFLPSEFKISEIDAFGAAYYNGQWKGVRFVGKK